ncbi:transposase [Streptomyces sp. NPDC087903]|uniref:IS110 family transposase n=1 Tax=Streptomyces sp. NPDC087903 TaxID=3365819 RepID=UPI003807D0F5
MATASAAGLWPCWPRDRLEKDADVAAVRHLRGVTLREVGPRGGQPDTKDAAVIADQARTRRDLQPLHTGDKTITDLKTLTDRHTNQAADPTRTVNWLRTQLTGTFPGLERAPTSFPHEAPLESSARTQPSVPRQPSPAAPRPSDVRATRRVS